jgi:predicted AlkP superfamily pyrophosphatase or phosphodiesterase
MKATVFRLLISMVAMAMAACSTTRETAEPARLVVVIVVDQMCHHHVDRFRDLYTGGLGRLLDEGAVFQNAWHDHAKTHTSPGHASIATGSFPSRHGVIANAWYDRNNDFTDTYSARDEKAHLVGYPDRAGASPKNLLRETVGDWLKRQSPGSKVCSVALKDYAAVMMGGRLADAVYWYDDNDGTYCSSTYYTDAYPTWVDAFNEARPADAYLDAVWTRTMPASAYERSRPDAFHAESDGVHTTFPYRISETAEAQKEGFYDYLRSTPFADELTLRFASIMTEENDLGMDDKPDLLFVGCSAADFIGHEWGPYSQEVEDYYIRLDGYLAEFFDGLDTKVGRGRYAVVLTSDHGVLPLPEGLAGEHERAERIDRKRYNGDVDRAADALVRELGIEPPLILHRKRGLVLNADAALEAGVTLTELRERVAREMVKLQYVEEVFTYDELADETAARPDNNGDSRAWQYYQLYKNTFHPGRSPDLYVVFEKYRLVTSMTHGTTHGSPHDYDRRAPLVLWGLGVAGGAVTEEVRTVDLAPTIARLLGISDPEDIDGQPLAAALAQTDGK